MAANLNFHQQELGKSLCEAAWKGSSNLCKFLLDAHGDSIARSRFSSCLYRPGRTALMWAASKGHLECVRVLLPHSDSYARDGKGMTALMHAAYRGHLEIVEELIPVSDPDARAQAKSGMTALMFAVSEGRRPCVDLLLRHGDPRQKTDDGSTLAMIALSAYGSFYVSKSHLGYAPSAEDIKRVIPYSDLGARNSKGQTALGICRDRMRRAQNNSSLFPDGEEIFAMLFALREAEAILEVMAPAWAPARSSAL